MSCRDRVCCGVEWQARTVESRIGATSLARREMVRQASRVAVRYDGTRPGRKDMAR